MTTDDREPLTPGQLKGLVDEGLKMAREVPSAGSTFAGSVARKLEGISRTVHKTNRVTPKQQRAVTNMIAGLQKWLEAPTRH